MKRRPLVGHPLVYGLALAAAAALCLAAPRAAHAQFTFIGPKQSFAPYHFFPAGAGGTMIQTDFPGMSIGERDHIVGFNSVKNIDDVNAVHDMFLNPSSPTLNFIRNPVTQVFGRIFRNTLVFNESTLNIAAGGIVFDPSVRSEFSGVLRTYDKSTVNLTAIGDIPSYYGFDHSTFNMTGGRVDFLLVKENATATIDGGAINVVSAGTINDERLFGDLMEVGSESVTIKNGAFRSLGASLGGFVAMTGGTLSGSASASGDGQMAFSNVNVPSVQARDVSQIFFSGGRLGGAAVVDNAGLFVTGTEVTGAITVNGNDGSAATISGGSVGGGVNVLQKSSAFLSNVAVRRAGAIDDSKLEILSGTTVMEDVVANGKGRVDMSGGSISGNLSANGNAKVSLTDGLVFGNVISSGNGGVTISGGRIFGGIRVADTGPNVEGVSVFGGIIDRPVEVLGTRSFSMHGGSAPRIDATGVQGGLRTFVLIDGSAAVVGDVNAFFATVTLAQGPGHRIGNDLSAFGQSQVFVEGGRIGNNLDISNPGTMASVSAGEVAGFLIARNEATVTVSGGTIVMGAQMDSGAKLTWTGGTIGGSGPPPAPSLRFDDLADAIMPEEPQKALLPSIHVSGNAQLDIVGADLVATLVDPNFNGMFSLYELTGRLADGTNIGGQTFLIQNGTGASFQLLAVPEPSSLALTGLTMAVLATIRRRRQR